MWKQLDFSGSDKGTLQDYRYSYGFDPDTCLKDLAKATGIPAIAGEKVLYHLEKGDAVTFKCPASGESLFLQVNPGDKNILIKDQGGKVVTASALVERQQALKKQDLANSQKLSRKRAPVRSQEKDASLSIA